MGVTGIERTVCVISEKEKKKKLRKVTMKLTKDPKTQALTGKYRERGTRTRADDPAPSPAPAPMLLCAHVCAKSANVPSRISWDWNLECRIEHTTSLV